MKTKDVKTAFTSIFAESKNDEDESGGNSGGGGGGEPCRQECFQDAAGEHDDRESVRRVGGADVFEGAIREHGVSTVAR